MGNTSDSFMPGPLLFCMKIERSVCYKVTDNTEPQTIDGEKVQNIRIFYKFVGEIN